MAKAAANKTTVKKTTVSKAKATSAKATKVTSTSTKAKTTAVVAKKTKASPKRKEEEETFNILVFEGIKNPKPSWKAIRWKSKDGSMYRETKSVENAQKVKTTMVPCTWIDNHGHVVGEL